MVASLPIITHFTPPPLSLLRPPPGADPMAASLLIECRGSTQEHLEENIREVKEALLRAGLPFGGRADALQELDVSFFGVLGVRAGKGGQFVCLVHELGVSCLLLGGLSAVCGAGYGGWEWCGAWPWRAASARTVLPGSEWPFPPCPVAPPPPVPHPSHPSPAPLCTLPYLPSPWSPYPQPHPRPYPYPYHTAPYIAVPQTYEFHHDAKKYKTYWDVRKGLIPIVGGAREPGTSMLLEDVACPVDR